MDDPCRDYCNGKIFNRRYSWCDPEHLLDCRQLMHLAVRPFPTFPRHPHLAYRPLLLTRLPSSALTLCFIG